MGSEMCIRDSYNSLDLISGRAQTLANLTTLKNGENKLITTRAIKLYADGALGSRGAALLAPYSDDDKNSGLMLLKESTAASIFDAALRNGTQVNTHAIGDRANRMVLNWYEAAFARTPKKQWAEKEPRWRICLLYTSPSPRDLSTSRMPSSA